MRTSRCDIFLVCSALLFASGCGGSSGGTRPVTQAPIPAPRSAVRAPTGAAVSPAAYFTEAAAIDLFEVRAAELAMQMSANARVKEFATMIASAHKGTAAQLSFAGRRLNLLPSATLTPKYQAMLDQLQATPDFDATFRRQQMVVHQQALSLHSGYAARGSSPTLRPVASAMVPIVERHLRLLRYL